MTTERTVWDRWLVRDLVGRRRVTDAADALSRAITPAQRKQWEQGDAVAWAHEAHKVAGQVAYHDVPPDGPPPTITKAYIDKATPAVAEQLTRAGVRLAAVLNVTFGGPATQPTATTTPSESLTIEIVRAVEIAQQKVPAPKPAQRPPRHTVENQEAPPPPPPDPLPAIADGLVDVSGLIAVQVTDVIKNEPGMIIMSAPKAVHDLRRTRR